MSDLSTVDCTMINRIFSEGDGRRKPSDGLHNSEEVEGKGEGLGRGQRSHVGGITFNRIISEGEGKRKPTGGLHILERR
jgi:hypothetical protein